MVGCHDNRYNVDALTDSIRLLLESFVSVQDHESPDELAQCVSLQTKVATMNATERDFLRATFQSIATNGTGTWVAQVRCVFVCAE